jgi:hypothetical protein
VLIFGGIFTSGKVLIQVPNSPVVCWSMLGTNHYVYATDSIPMGVCADPIATIVAHFPPLYTPCHCFASSERSVYYTNPYYLGLERRF